MPTWNINYCCLFEFYLELIINAIVINENVDWSRIAIYNSKFPIFIRKLGAGIPNP